MIEQPDFNLNDEANVIKLHGILISLEDMYLQDIKQFKIMFKNLPLNIYVKIDNLRTTNTDNKSGLFKEIILKSKDISKKFHEQFK